MRRRITITIVSLALLAACGSSSKTDAGTAVTIDPSKYVDKTTEQTVTITARDNFFTPQFVKVKKGTTIVFDNGGRNEHNVISGDGAFTNIETNAFEPGTEKKVVLDQTGAHGFMCSLHGTATNGMYGSLLVVP